MSEVIDFQQKKLESGTHLSGPVRCLSCKHEWTAVVAVGTISIECPSCGLMRGTHTEIVMPENGIVWQCSCGNNLFVISSAANAICIGCGNLQRIRTDD